MSWDDPILTRSFVLLDRVGPRRERRLWLKGVEDWTTFLDRPRAPGFRSEAKRAADRMLRRAGEAVDGRSAEQLRWLATRFPRGEQWRLLAHANPRIGYLDIETTGSGENGITVVGVHTQADGYRAFVKEKNLTEDNLQQHFAQFDCLVTFNGGAFDVPIIAGAFPNLVFPPLHVDLRNALARLGITGGLKRIEVAMGVNRPPSVVGLSGWDAVKLWRRWYLTSDREAYQTLLDYNRCDVENLEPLARHAFRELAKATLDGSLEKLARMAHEKRLTEKRLGEFQATVPSAR